MRLGFFALSGRVRRKPLGGAPSVVAGLRAEVLKCVAAGRSADLAMGEKC